MVNIYNEAYSLLLEILSDNIIQDFVFDATGKHLAIINSNVQVSAPAAKISFLGGNISLSDNSVKNTSYNIEFFLPLWGDQAFAVCHDFIDTALFAFSNHETRSNGKRNYVTNIDPSINKINDDSECWVVSFSLTISIFL